MKKIIALLLVLVFLFTAAVAEFDGVLEFTAKSAMKKALDDADAFEAALESNEISVSVVDGASYLTIGGTTFAFDEKMNTAAQFLSDMDMQLQAFSVALKNYLDVKTENLPPRTDVFSSLFTISRYTELNRKETLELLDSDVVKMLFFAAGWDGAELTACDTLKSELTYFCLNDLYLMQLDITADNRAVLISSSRDDAGFTFSMYTDLNVTDWDDCKEAIESFSAPDGFGVSMFVLYFDEGQETYLEVAPYVNGRDVVYEISRLSDDTDSNACGYDILLVLNGKKYLEIESSGVLQTTAPEGEVKNISELSGACDENVVNAFKTIEEALLK